MIVTEPQVGDIGLVKVGGFVGWLIRNMQWLNGAPRKDCHFEHSFMCTDPANGYGFEAQPGGAHFFKYTDRYQADQIVWIRPVKLDNYEMAELVKQAEILKGTPYSFIEYDALLLHRMHLPIPGLKNYINSTDHMICSQIIAEMYRRIGCELFGGEWPGYVTPVDYYTFYGDKSVSTTA